MNKLFAVSISTFMLVFATQLVAQACGGGCKCGVENNAKASENAVEVGNKLCPVMEQPVSQEHAIKVEHEGKIYNLCCPGCIEVFKQEPVKYIEKLKSMEQSTYIDNNSCNQKQSCHS